MSAVTNLDSFTHAYIEAMLWSSTTDDDTPMDAEYGIDDLAPETLDRIQKDCREFQEQNGETITDAECRRNSSGCSIWEQAGHDFWLTRNGHGCGFWDDDWSEPAATVLDNASKKAGGLDLYVGDDGKLYF